MSAPGPVTAEIPPEIDLYYIGVSPGGSRAGVTLSGRFVPGSPQLPIPLASVVGLRSLVPEGTTEPLLWPVDKATFDGWMRDSPVDDAAQELIDALDQGRVSLTDRAAKACVAVKDALAGEAG